MCDPAIPTAGGDTWWRIRARVTRCCTTVQPGNEILARVKIPNNLRPYNLIACSAAGEQFKIWGVARSLVKADKKGNALVRILNPRSEALVLAKNRAIAKLIPVNIESDKTATICPSADVYYIKPTQKPSMGNIETDGKTVKQNKSSHAHRVSDEILNKFCQDYEITIGSQLNSEQRRLVLLTLYDFKDVLARKTTDLTPQPTKVDVPINILSHKT